MGTPEQSSEYGTEEPCAGILLARIWEGRMGGME